MARLILVDPNLIGAGVDPDEAATLPTLETFARERGFQDFSQAGQTDAYAEAFGADTCHAGGHAYLVKCHSYDSTVSTARLPKKRAAGGVRTWHSPALARRLYRPSLPALFCPGQRINGIGACGWTAPAGHGIADRTGPIASVESRIERRSMPLRQALPTLRGHEAKRILPWIGGTPLRTISVFPVKCTG